MDLGKLDVGPDNVHVLVKGQLCARATHGLHHHQEARLGPESLCRVVNIEALAFAAAGRGRACVWRGRGRGRALAVVRRVILVNGKEPLHEEANVAADVAQAA